MARSTLKMLVLLAALLMSFATGACRVRQTEEGKLPEVNVSTEKGKLPEYDVDTAKVNVKTEKKEITVPKVEVQMPPSDKTKDKDEEKKPPQP